MSSMQQNEAEVLVAELCERFVSLFTEMSSIAEDRANLRAERKSLQIMLNEQKELSECNIRNLQQEVLEIEKKISEGPNLDEEHSKEELEYQIEDLSNKISHKSNMLELLHEKKENLLKSNEQKVEELENKQLSIMSLSKRIEDVDSSLNVQNSQMNQLEEAVNDLEGKKSYLTSKIEETLGNIQRSEEEFKTLLHSRLEKKEIFRNSAEDFRKILQENTEINKRIDLICKRLVKSKNELDSKEQRVIALNSTHESFSAKLKKLEIQNKAAHQQAQANETLESELKALKSQYEGYVHEKWDNKCEHRIKRMVNEIVKNPEFKESQYQANSDDEEFSSMRSPLEKAVENGNKEKDEEILANEIEISSIKKEIEEVRNRVYSAQLQKEVAEQKFKAFEGSQSGEEDEIL